MLGTGTITDISIDYENKKTKVVLLLDVEASVIEKLKGIKLFVDLKKWFKKRSLDANAYCWVLCDKIAKELSKDGTIVTKEDVYKDSILQIGTFKPQIWEEKDFEDTKRIWEKQGLGFIVQEVCRKDKCVKVHCYFGSSSYNTQQMSLIIESLVELAKSLDIETKSQVEIKSLLEEWK